MKLTYRKDIDGLRALAVISIVLFHAGFAVFEGGYVGVDIFFVISGFLITSIILEEHRRGEFSFSAFYERRARRLLPALYFVLILTLPFAWIGMLPGELTEFSKSLLSVLAFCSNFFFWNDSGYFATSAEFRPLLHTWSLGVEEQFYFIFPAVLLLALSLVRSVSIALLLLLGMFSFAFSAWASIYRPTFAFFMLPTRTWEFILGALGAFFVITPYYAQLQKRRILIEIGSLIGLSLVAYSVFFFKKNYIFPGYWALIPVFGAGFLLVFATERTLIGRALGTKPLVIIGLMSYSVYLWHQPLFVFVRLRELDPLDSHVVWALVLCSFGLGYLTWRFIEPIWRIGKKTPKRSFWWFIGFCTCTFILFFLIIKHTGGSLFRLNHLPKDYFQTSWINYKFFGLNNQQCYTDVMKPCVLASFPEQMRNMLLLGDSHAGDFGGVFAEYLNSHKMNGSMFSLLGCGYVSNLRDNPSNTSCSKARALVLDLARQRAFTTYLLVGAGELHTAAEVSEFEKLTKELLDSGAEVILFTPRARLKYDPKKAGVLQQNSKNSVVFFDPALNVDWDIALEKLSANSNFKIFDQAQALLELGCGRADCFDGHSRDGHLIFRDPTHLTDMGAGAVFKNFDAWYSKITPRSD